MPNRVRRKRCRRNPARILLAVVLIAAAAYAGIHCLLFQKPQQVQAVEQLNEEEQNAEQAQVDGEAEALRSHQERKADFYTILVSGVDDGNGNSDTNILVAVDTAGGSIYGVSIPRDTKAVWNGKSHKINAAFGSGGIEKLADVIGDQLGIPVDYTVQVDLKGFVALVDAIGGVDFDVPIDMNYEDPYQDLYIHIPAGMQHLSGEEALKVVRFREGYASQDIARMETQQAFLTAMVEQLLKIENIAKINAFAEVFRENVETDLTLQNILWFAKAAFTGGLKPENVEFVTMPNTPAYAYSSTTSKLNGRYSEQSYVTPNTSQLLELVNTKLSPYAEVFTRSDLDMMTVNSDGSVSSSTGHVEDSNATHPRSHWQAQWTPQEPEEETPPEGETGTGTGPDAGAPETGGGETTDPGGATEPGTGSIDPDTGDLIDPETGGIIDPGTGQILDPGTGQVIGQLPGGSGDPAAGESGGTAPESPDSQPSDGETAPPVDPGTSDGGTAAPDDGFIIVT